MNTDSKVENCHIKTCAEMLAEIEEEQKEFRKNPRIGDIRYCKRDKCLVIEGAGRGYDIPLSRLQSSKEAFDWLCHLHQKLWFTPKMHSDLLEMILRTADVNEYCFKW